MLLQATVNEPIAVPIFLASFYGLRRSEVLGLRWSAINFEEGTFGISTTVVREKHENRIITVVRDQTTKTESSMRVLPLPLCLSVFFKFAAVSSLPKKIMRQLL